MKYTPKQIVEENLFFSIPIYQRLFEWSDENIQTLLTDLLNCFNVYRGKHDYYIGMLTSTKENELVDGQQRFTVMMLLGCAFKQFDFWKEFIECNKHQRLSFLSRQNDEDYMQWLISDDNEGEKIRYENLKMKAGIQCINDFLANKVKDREAFAKYVYEHLSFFISYLPDKYTPRDLNKYFERMNCSGKNLEQHEILKVKLLSNLNKNVSRYMKLWNILSDVDTPMIRLRENEKEHQFRDRKQYAINSTLADLLDSNYINGLNDEEKTDKKKIKDIPVSKIAPTQDKAIVRDSRCPISFPYLLLNTLYYFRRGKILIPIDDFFKQNNLIEVFSKHLPFEGDEVNVNDIKEFLQLLVKCRLALDICFVRPTDYGYDLDMNLTKDDENCKKLMMLESMLYVYSSNYTTYRWFGWLMDAINTFGGVPDAEELYNHLKCEDDKLNPLKSVNELTYNGDIRYELWRLDMYIWLNRNEIFKDDPKAKAVAEKYVFARNRSREHVAPQTPQSNSTFVWDESDEDNRIMNSFGNLVLISQGLNSSLLNESFEVKRAHVEAYCNGSKSGSIESLKLLLIYSRYGNEWNRKTISDHQKEAYEMLEDSYE